MNNPCLQFLHIHGQFHKPESFPLLFMTFFSGRGKEGSWFGVVGRRGGGGKRLFSMPGVAPFSVPPLFLGPEDYVNSSKLHPRFSSGLRFCELAGHLFLFYKIGQVL